MSTKLPIKNFICFDDCYQVSVVVPEHISAHPLERTYI